MLALQDQTQYQNRLWFLDSMGRPGRLRTSEVSGRRKLPDLDDVSM